VLLVLPTGDHLKYVVQLGFSREDATNTHQNTKACLPVSGSQQGWAFPIWWFRVTPSYGQPSQQGLRLPTNLGMRG
jgi:hypothetical protein